MSFVIQSGISLPSKTRGAGQSKYPLDKLEVDQSFFIAAATKATGVTLSKLAKNLDIAITTRATTEAPLDAEGNATGDAVKGLRVWRIEPVVKAAA